ncbi:MAG: hypothetical protein JOZ47_01150 [Kutzneria sp.]|nr:hypothetical protein [Kutzneria sp.]
MTLRQGEIRQVLAIKAPVAIHVAVLSGAAYLEAGKGRCVVCRVLPGAVPDDFTSVHRVTYRTAAGIDTIGLAVPDLIEWYPASALGEQVLGTVQNMSKLLALVEALFR